MDTKFTNVEEISDGGERVSHLNKDVGFFAHLSIYEFALPYCRMGVVLDAGCGAGYGSAFLADQGADRVYGIDLSEKAIAFSQHHFGGANLTFQQMSVEEIVGFQRNQFDVIYSSNTLEHVPHVSQFLRHAWELLKPNGTLILAVPPITDERLEYLNIINPYHVNIWSPRQWEAALGEYFGSIQPVAHGVEAFGRDFQPQHFQPDSILTEKSFVFELCDVQQMYDAFTLTSIFVVKGPKSAESIPQLGSPIKMIDNSFTRPEGHIALEVQQRLKRFFDMPSPPYVLSQDEPELEQSDGILIRLVDVVKRIIDRLSR